MDKKKGKSIPKRMLEDKQSIQEYLRTKDESKRVATQFAGIIPLSACAGEKHL